MTCLPSIHSLTGKKLLPVTPHCHRTRRAALTLLEVVLASGLLVLFMGSVFWFYGSALETAEEGTARTRDVQLARVVMARMAKEIRQASGNTTGFGPGLIGFDESISVNTLVLPDKIVSRRQGVTDDPIAAQFDLQEVRYYIAWDEENLDDEGNPRSLGLVRKVSKTFNRGVIINTDSEDDNVESEAVAVKEEMYAPEIKYLEFKYFDGASWWDDWQIAQGNSLPMMVRITLGFVPQPPDDEELELVEDDFLRAEEERDPLPDDRFTMFVKLVQA
ncbi:MAG: type II secretion system protein J, partial [Phycisphaerae bacterium]